MTQVVLEFGAGAFSALRMAPEEFSRELKLAAVVQWYSEGRVSQSKATEILDVSRQAFLQELARRRIPACQVTAEEVIEEAHGF